MKKTLIATAAAATIAITAISGAVFASGGYFNPEARFERLSETLNLSEAQQTELKTLFEQRKTEYKAEKDDEHCEKEGRHGHYKMRKQMKNDIESILTDEQKAQFEQMKFGKKRWHHDDDDHHEDNH